jgi:hypothetical protein
VPTILHRTARTCRRSLSSRSALVLLAILLAGALPSWRAARPGRLVPSSHANRQRGQSVAAASWLDTRCAVHTSPRAVVTPGTASDRRHDRAASGHPWAALVAAPRERTPGGTSVAVGTRARGISVAGLPAPSSRAPPLG